MDQASKLDALFRDAEGHGTWADYAVYTLGDVDSGDEDLDNAISELYIANEAVHRIANKLALRYDVPFFEGDRP